MEYRIEKDLLGEKKVPQGAYWGIHTQRALENFQLSPYRVNAGLIRSLALVKKAACLANAELKFIPAEKARAICQACDEIYCGKLAQEFPVDALQAGAGTSTNMNINEVIANRALEILGRKKGDYAFLHPIEDVNLHQSTNDVYPTALKISAICGVRRLSEKNASLQGEFQKKEKGFAQIVKIGRTELQDAVPITLGLEFGAFAEAFSRDRWRAFKCEERLRAVNIGGTAVGTGLTAPRKYIFLVIEKLRELSGFGIMRSENVADATANADVFVEVSGILKSHASNLIKVANDLRLLNLLGEIRLPALQAGSSIMPGKVNPVCLEAIIQAGIKVFSNDITIADCVSRGSLQINEFLPLVAHSLLESLDLLSAVDAMFEEHLKGIEACEEACRRHLEESVSIITAFLPEIGYEKAQKLLKEFQSSAGKNFRSFLCRKLGEKKVNETLSADKLLSLGYNHERNA